MHKEFPKKIILKDGSPCEFRNEFSENIDEYIDFFKRVSPEDLWAMNNDYTNRKKVELFINKLRSDETVQIVAYQSESMIGIGVINFTRFGSKKNIGEIEMILDRSYKQKRLGTWLMLELSELAIKEKIELLKIELMAGKDDPVIIALKRTNFIPQAILKNYLKDKKGNYTDMVIMIREINEERSDY